MLRDPISGRPFINIRRRQIKAQDLAPLVDRQMQLEAVISTGRTLIARCTALENPVRPDPQIVTNFQARGIDKRNADALPALFQKIEKQRHPRISTAVAQIGDNCTRREIPIGNDT